MSHPKALSTIKRLKQWCSSRKIACFTVETGSHIKPSDLIISMGGDGTLLSVARVAASSGTPVLGVNMGRMGFLSDTHPEELTALLDDFSRRGFDVEKRTMLDILLPSGRSELALNECVVKRVETGKPAALSVWVNGEFLADYVGDGIIIATPTGSTAYSLSAGGPIIHPHLEAIIITPVSPHTLTQRPLIISTEHSVEIRRPPKSGMLSVFADGRLVAEGLAGGFEIRPSRKKFILAVNPSKKFFGTLREKLNWGKR